MNFVKTPNRTIKLFIVNFITLLRIPLSLMLFLNLLTGEKHIVFHLIFFFITVITDISDGRLARKFNIQTSFGAYADVFCDFFYIILLNSALCQKGLIPLWMIILIILKFLEFVTTSRLIKKKSRFKITFVFDLIGRYTAAAFYVLPTITILIYEGLGKVFFNNAIPVILILILSGSLISGFQRIIVSMKSIKEPNY